MSVLLETSAGDLVIDLLLDEVPKTCLNFLKLCKAKYYNFSPFYNLQAPSFFQGGDPSYPVGDGGSSCWGLQDDSQRFFKSEISRREHVRGTISMVCTDDGYCGSQFFVSIGSNPAFDKKHVVFGRLAEGLDTLDKIAEQAVDEKFRPLRDIRIKHTIVLEDPYEDPPGFGPIPPSSPLPSAAQLSTVRLDFDENVEETGSVDDLEARKRAREADASALTLETLGDLPFASIRPPENTLFVCKLNPVTSSSDLALIFGRYGKIMSCQVIKDSRTGDSLQYAFIEFDVKEDAERAYYKMQGVLIDDRRIHVDFSQSVAKLPQGLTLRATEREKRSARGYYRSTHVDRERSSHPEQSQPRAKHKDRSGSRHERDTRDRRHGRSRSRSISRSRSPSRQRSKHRSRY